MPEIGDAKLLDDHEMRPPLEYALEPDDPEAPAFQMDVSIEDLPLMPEPDSELQFSQSIGGVTFVIVAIAAAVGVTHGVGLNLHSLPTSWWWFCLIFIYAQAAAALGCLAILLFGDPGRILRSEVTCYPVPPEVAERLKSGESLEGLENVRDGNRSYCVRCCVWRTHPMVSPSLLCCFDCERHPHHCRVCGRCVDGFDHHCGVFGRCIANKNMPFFAMLVGLGYVGFISTLVITIVSIGLSYD